MRKAIFLALVLVKFFFASDTGSLLILLTSVRRRQGAHFKNFTIQQTEEEPGMNIGDKA